jgi:hypothetical protein
MTSTNKNAGLPLEDLALLAGLQRGNDWLRGVLCTLARRGLGFRQQAPERAEQLLAALSRYPYYKAGQFVFDLMEWEDFMLDGPPPPLVPTALDGPALKRITELLNEFRQHLDGALPDVVPEIVPATNEQPALEATLDSDLPPLEASLYLYQEVVLGILCSARSLIVVETDIG